MKYIVVFMCLLSVFPSCIDDFAEEDVQYTVRGRMTYYNKSFDDVRLEFYKEVSINNKLSYQFMGETESESDGFFIFDYLGPSYEFGNMRVIALNDSGEIRTFKNLSYAKSWTQNLNLADSTKAILTLKSSNPLKAGDTLFLRIGTFQRKYIGPILSGAKDTVTLKNADGQFKITTKPNDPTQTSVINYYPAGPPIVDAVTIYYYN